MQMDYNQHRNPDQTRMIGSVKTHFFFIIWPYFICTSIRINLQSDVTPSPSYDVSNALFDMLHSLCNYVVFIMYAFCVWAE